MRNVDKYLAALVRASLKGEKAPNLPEGVSVDEIVSIAAKSHMNCILLSALVNVDNISDSERDKLRGIVLRSMLKASMQLQEVKVLDAKFEEEQIVNQPMKGAILRLIYPSPEMREMSDLDILIAENDMDRAVTVLLDCGYVLKESIKHHDIYVKKPFMVVEAHRAMYDKTVDKNQNRYFDNFSKTHVAKGHKVTHEFGIEDFYVYMMAHMAKHFYQTGCGIRHLVDIYVYLGHYGSSIDREYVDRELEECGILTFTRHMEKLAFDWIDGKDTESLYSEIFLYMIDAGIYGKDENGIWNKFADEEKNGKTLSRGRLKRWYFFPPLYYMSEYYPYLAEKPWLLPWAWFVRGVEGILRKKGSMKRKMIDEIGMDDVKKRQHIYKEMGLKFSSK
ncbi:MAG: hypothetical protein E7265_05860 [Lachnospiraceae bacterium]|nr:hypothetical protein [Lachnospiraceae bacterium]